MLTEGHHCNRINTFHSSTYTIGKDFPKGLSTSASGTLYLDIALTFLSPFPKGISTEI